MSLIDFSQDAQDQGCIHIVVEALSEASSVLCKNVLDYLCKLPPLQLKGTVLFPRFLDARNLPTWATDNPKCKWDEFSAHKQVLGVLAISNCTDTDDLDNAKAGFGKVCARFKSTHCKTKCVIYGPKKYLEQYVDSARGYRLIDCGSDEDGTDVHKKDLEETINEFAVLINASLREMIEQEENVLSSRLEQLKLLRSPSELREGDDEQSFVGEARYQSRNLLLGRHEKHCADLYLLTGQLQKANTYYRNAFEHLKSCKDFLWLGSACEGLSVTAMITKQCEAVWGQKAQGTEIASSGSIFSFKKPNSIAKRMGSSTGSGNSTSLSSRTSYTLGRRPPEEKPDPTAARVAKYTTIRRPPVKTPGSNSDLKTAEEAGIGNGSVNGERGLLMKDIPSALSSTQQHQDSSSSHVVSEEDESSLDGERSSEPTEEDVDEEDVGLELLVDRRLLQKDFIVNNYSIALMYFKKACEKGVISQIEGFLKFSKYLVSQKRCVYAADVLQRMLKIDNPHFVTELDKLNMYCTMAEVYRSMGFKRKAAMFTHYAARWANELAKDSQSPILSQAHSLLVECLPGYKLSLDLDSLPRNGVSNLGWPALQACILKDFVFLARTKYDNHQALSFTCYLLQVLHKHLSTSEMRDVASMLTDIVEETREKLNTDPSSVASLASLLNAPFPLDNFPTIRYFTPKHLVPHLTPLKEAGFVSPSSLTKTEGDKDGDSASGSSGPFIYTPFGDKRKKKDKRPEVLWVEGDPGDINMFISNPLPIELRVEKMTALTDGLQIDAFPSSLTLPPFSEPQSFILANIPREAGTLNILGYEAFVFGVSTKCMMKLHGNPVVQVVPSLPFLRLSVISADEINNRRTSSTTIGGSSTGEANKAVISSFELLDGETTHIEFRLECCKGIDVESVTVAIDDYNKDYCTFSWSEKSIESFLPLKPDHSGTIPVTIKTQIPAWFRIINDIAIGFSKRKVLKNGGLLALSNSSTPSPDMLQSSSSATNTPNSSPVLKQPRNPLAVNFLGRNTGKRKVSADAAYAHSAESSLVDSLNLDHPSFSTGTKTLPSLARTFAPQFKNQSLRRAKPQHKGHSHKISFGDIEAQLDFDFTGNKRASVRSDPGDRNNSQTPTHGGKSTPSRPQSSESGSSSGSGSKPIPIPKSETIAGRIPEFGSVIESSPVLNRGSGRTHQRMHSYGLSPNLNSASRFSSGMRGSLKATSANRRQQSSQIDKKEISEPVGPLFKEIPRPPNRTKIVGEFKIDYRGGKGSEEGYYRQALASVPVIVKPSIMFEQFDVNSLERAENLFELTFTVHNLSKYRLDITCDINQEGLAECGEKIEHKLTLDPTCSEEMKLTMKRFHISGSTDMGMKNESVLVKLYCDRLIEMVKFKWRVSESNRQGSVSLEGLKLPASTVRLMTPVPLLLDITLNGYTVISTHGGYIEDADVGVPQKLSMKVTNNSGQPVTSSLLIFEPYQFSQEMKRIVKDLEGKMLLSGSLISRIPKLAPGATYRHDMNLVFVYTGEYQLDVKFMIPLQKNHSQSRHGKRDQKSRERDIQEKSQEKRTAEREKSLDEENVSLSSSTELNPPTPPSPSPSPSPSANRPSSPVVLPKSVRALTRKMESDFLAKKSSPSPPSSPNRRTSRQNNTSTNSTTYPLSVTHSANPSSSTSSSSVTSSPKSQLRKAQSFNMHSTTTTSSSTATAAKGGSTTRSMTVVSGKRKAPLYRTSSSAFAQPQPVMDSVVTKKAATAAARGAAGSSSDKDTHGQNRNSRGTMPERMISSVLISKESQYKRLIRTRSEDSKSVRVLAGPHFTFHVT